MPNDFILNFVNGETGENVVTISGKQAKEIVKHSEFLQMLLENEPNLRKLTIPLLFPYGRIALFKKLMTGQPVGRSMLNSQGVQYDDFFPLTPEEEEIIRNLELRPNNYNSYVSNFNYRTFNERNYERAKAVEDVLRFFMFDDPSFAKSFIKFQPLSRENEEFLRRKAIFERRQFPDPRKNVGENNQYFDQPNAKAIPFLNEDTIENLVEKHKNYLFGVYHPRKRTKLNLYLTRKNINNRQRRFYEQSEKEERNLQKREDRVRRAISQRVRRSRWSSNDNNYNNQHLNNNLQQSRINPYYFYEKSNFDSRSILNTNLHPFSNESLNTMSSLEFERYLRSLRREGEEKYLPYQGPLVGNLFGNQSNL